MSTDAKKSAVLVGLSVPFLGLAGAFVLKSLGPDVWVGANSAGGAAVHQYRHGPH